MLINKLKQWRAGRHKNGITKAHLARMIKVSRSYITKMESGKAQPSAEVMFRIANYFGCKVDEIFSVKKRASKRG